MVSLMALYYGHSNFLRKENASLGRKMLLKTYMNIRNK